MASPILMATWAQAFEAVMLLCFGISWPVSIFRTYRAKSVAGKSLLFLTLIFTGYLAGIVAKVIRAWNQGVVPEWVTSLYILNALLVATDIALYLRYRKQEHRPLRG